VYAAEVNTERSFSVFAREPISTHPVNVGFTRPYAVAPDNQRLLIMEAGSSETGALILVQNFSEELKATVGN